MYKCRFSAPRPFRRAFLLRAHSGGLSCSTPIQARVGLHLLPLSHPPIWVFLHHVLAHPHLRCPDGLRARHRSVRWDVYGPDHRFDPLRPPVFVEGGGASPAGWPLHRITSALHNPWRHSWARYSIMSPLSDGHARIRSGAEIFAPCRQYSCTMRWLIRVLTILFLSLFLS